MGVRKIPESYLFTCEGCGKEHSQAYPRRPTGWCDVTLARDALDYQGAAVGDGSIQLLVCPGCLTVVEAAITNALAAQRRS